MKFFSHSLFRLSSRSIKWFLLAFALGFLLPKSYGPLLLASTTDLDSDYDEYSSPEEALESYHLWTNAIVNNYLEGILNEEEPDVSYPADDEKCESSGKNVSTYCLAVVLNANLEQFEIYLATHKDELNAEEEEENSGPKSLPEALEEATEQRSTFERQGELSEDALDLTLAVYNQIQLVYPMHKELKKFFLNLEDYRKNLSLLRDVIEKYPAKFNGASTAQCK